MRIPDVSIEQWLCFLWCVVTQVCLLSFVSVIHVAMFDSACSSPCSPYVLHVSDFIEYDDAAEEFHPFIKFFATFSSKVSKTQTF